MRFPSCDGLARPDASYWASPITTPSFGFTAEPSLTLHGVPPEYFQAVTFAGPLPVGEVSYHESFAAQG